MKNSSCYIAPVGDRTHDLPHTVASNMVKVSHALNHMATAAFKQYARITLWVEAWNTLSWTINWVAWQRDHPKWTLGQRHRWALVHLELRVQKGRCRAMMKMWKLALSNRCMWLWEETDYVSSYDIWWCPQLHVDWRGYPNPCRCQLYQTLGGIYLTAAIEDSTKKKLTSHALTCLIVDCQKQNEEQIIYSPILTFRNDSDRTGLCSKRSDIHGMSTCCHLVNRLALPVKFSVWNL